MEILKQITKYLIERKKFWLLPLVIIFFLFSLLLVLTNTALAPFIYTLF